MLLFAEASGAETQTVAPPPSSPIIINNPSSDASWAAVALASVIFLTQLLRFLQSWLDKRDVKQAIDTKTTEQTKELKEDLEKTVKPIAKDIAEHRKECTPVLVKEAVKQAIKETQSESNTDILAAREEGRIAGGDEERRNPTPTTRRENGP